MFKMNPEEGIGLKRISFHSSDAKSEFDDIEPIEKKFTCFEISVYIQNIVFVSKPACRFWNTASESLKNF